MLAKNWFIIGVAPPKTNISPKKGPKESSLPTISFKEGIPLSVADFRDWSVKILLPDDLTDLSWEPASQKPRGFVNVTGWTKTVH